MNTNKTEPIAHDLLPAAPAAAIAPPVQPVAATPQAVSDAYEQVDRYLRNNLHDNDYADYSNALETVFCATTQPQQSAAMPPAEQVLRDALTKLLGQVNNIEVLGEWVATDTNITAERKLRAQVDAVIKDCRAAINPTGGTTP